MSKNKKVNIGIFIAILIIVIGVVAIYKIIEKRVTNRADFNFETQNISPNPVDTINYEKNNENETNIENVNIEELKKIAQKYYDNTVFEVISMNLKSERENKIILEVVCKKGGVLQEPNRTITLEKKNNDWEVVGEGY